jgi:hypothetical protein
VAVAKVGRGKVANINPLQIEAWFEALTSLPQGKKESSLHLGNSFKQSPAFTGDILRCQ